MQHSWPAVYRSAKTWFTQVWWPFTQGLFQDFSRTFNNVQGVRFHRHDYHIFSTDHSKKAEFPFPHDTKANEDNVTGCSPPILLLFSCLSLFMCDFNADSPMFEMSIIRSQHLQKAFFTQPARCLENPNSEYSRIVWIVSNSVNSGEQLRKVKNSRQ